LSRIDILAFGEPLAELAEVERGGARVFLPGVGGDASNAAVAAARQGASTAFFTALGDDAFGRDILAMWDHEGIDRSRVILRDGGDTGVYFITYGTSGHVFTYRRAGSAASLVTPAELPLDLIAGARVLHVSGISQAISPSCRDAVLAAIRQARASGVAVSYDTNLRLRLWPLDEARAAIHEAVALADIALPGLDDARLLTGETTPDAIVDFYLQLGSRIVALTLGREGALIATPTERCLNASRPVDAVDATGAGDAFDGAFLAEWTRHADPFRAGAYANAAAALSTLKHGAIPAIPTRAEVEAFMGA